MKEKSGDYLQRCLDTLKADNTVSDETKVIMFNEYARLLDIEKRQPDIEEIIIVLDGAQMEIRTMYKRLGFKGSNILDDVDTLLAKYMAIIPPPEFEQPALEDETLSPPVIYQGDEPKQAELL